MSDWEKCKIADFSKLDIRDGAIHYGLYQQDGSFERMRLPDTLYNRLFVSWVQIHDRYTPGTHPYTRERPR